MSKMIAIILMIAGSAFLVTGIVMYSLSPKKSEPIKIDNELDNYIALVIADGVISNSEKEHLKKIATEKSLNYDSIILDIEKKLRQRLIPAETEVIDQDKKKGDDFEKFIVQKFSKKYFKIKEWAGDKYVNGHFAETTQNPDLLLEFTLHNDSKFLAIECKWRKELNNNGIEFANKEQFERYKKYQNDKDIPVFVAIGIGGEGKHPQKLYIVPLKYIKSNFISFSDFEMYEINKGKDFFFNMKTEELD